MSEARVDRLDRLEEDVREIKTALAGLVPLIHRIDERLTTELPHLATKADLADKPSRSYLWGVMGAMVGAQAVALAAAALIFAFLQTRPAPQPLPAPRASVVPAGLVLAGDGPQQQPPYSCRLYYDEQQKCAFGSCDARTIERLKRECLRDGGRP